MTEATQLERANEGHLLDQPQRLGIWPTWRFWNDRENWRLVGLGFGIFGAVVNFVLMSLPLHPLVGGAIAGGAMILAIGLLEKYIRWQATKRRHALAAAELENESAANKE